MGLIRGQASLSGQSRRLPHALLVAAVVLDVGYVIALADANGLAGTVATFWLSHATQWVPVALFWIVAMNARIHRPEVVLAAAAVTFSALGDSYYSIAMGSDGYLHSPSVADIGYLMFYPLMLCSIGVFARRQTARVDRAVMLDAAVASLGAAALVAVLLSPLLGDALTGTSVLTMVVNIAYPLFDLILIAAVVGIAASPTVDAGRRWKGLVAGLLVFTAADIVYALLDHVGAYVSDTPLDALWAVGLTLIAWWIHGLAAPDLSEVTPQRPHSTHISLPVTAFGYIAGLGVLLYGAQVPVSGLALGLATATVALAALPVIFRQALLSRMLSEKQRVLDEFDRLDRSKSEMLETMNHELRTPLTSIVGYLEVVRDGGGGRIPAAADDMLAVVETNAARMQKLVDEMLVMTRLDSGAFSTIFSVVDLAEVVADVHRAVAPLATSREVDTKFVGIDRVFNVYGDHANLQLALTHLVENAIKFTAASGWVTVTTTEVVDLQGAEMVISISDTGVGIPAQEVPHLFTRLFRGSHARSGAVPGAGLGMSIAQAIVAAHQGTISVESTVGEGTTVQMRLPQRDTP